MMPSGASDWKLRTLRYLQQFPAAALLDTCGHTGDTYGRFEWLAAAGHRLLDRWAGFAAVADSETEWCFATLPYELKRRFEPSCLSSLAPLVAWPETPAFVPEWVLGWLPGAVAPQVLFGPQDVLSDIAAQAPVVPAAPALHFEPLHTDSEYLLAVEALRAHITAGDAYEINLARHFHAPQPVANPEAAFAQLTTVARVPFAALFRWQHLALLSGSMERFLTRRGDQVVTQPIKGTRYRGQDAQQDALQEANLRTSAKDRAENIMIVDMARNDLYRSCAWDSVQVPQLFGVRAYPTVWQMLSTVTGTLRPGVRNSQVLANAFPPASMTGAPKIAAMQLIDHYEAAARGAYAGALGWFAPGGDFDLSVLIRAAYTDRQAGTTAYQVGGAITFDSDAEAELAETEWKAAALRRVFGSGAT